MVVCRSDVTNPAIQAWCKRVRTQVARRVAWLILIRATVMQLAIPLAQSPSRHRSVTGLPRLDGTADVVGAEQKIDVPSRGWPMLGVGGSRIECPAAAEGSTSR
jgi:hypothetical protein